MSLKYMVPPGWKQVSVNHPDGVFSIMRGKSGIYFTVTSGGQMPPDPRDSRHLVWTASRFASVRKLPLQQWTTPRHWRVYEADRKHPKRDTRVISGANDRYEFEAIVFIYDPETTANVYAALDSLFAATTDASGNHVFAGLIATNVNKKTVSPVLSGSEWSIGRQTIRIPNGWVPDDTIFPVPPLYLPSAAPVMLSLGRIEGPLANSFDLNIQWLQAPELRQFDGKHRATVWTMQAERWKHEGGTALTPKPNATPLTESFVGSARRSRSSASGIAFDIHWYYRSKNLALMAFGRAPSVQACGVHEAALSDIIRQLE